MTANKPYARPLTDVQMVHWFHPVDGGPGKIDIGGQLYEYTPTPAGDLGSAEMSRVKICRLDPETPRARPVRVYYCRSFADGSLDCTCPDYLYRSRPNGRMCKHIAALTDFGIVQELEPEPVGEEAPW